MNKRSKIEQPLQDEQDGETDMFFPLDTIKRETQHFTT